MGQPEEGESLGTRPEQKPMSLLYMKTSRCQFYVGEEVGITALSRTRFGRRGTWQMTDQFLKNRRKHHLHREENANNVYKGAI